MASGQFGQRHPTDEIQCRPFVSEEDIFEYREHCPEKCDNCRNVMLKAYQFARRASETCLESIEITCHCEHFSLRFWCGSRGNQILIMSNNGNIDITMEKQTWREWFTGNMKKAIRRTSEDDSKINNSQAQGQQPRKIEKIECFREVRHEDINKFMEHCPNKNCTFCRQIMQKARIIVTATSKPCRENFDILCYCEHFSLRFWSGSRANRVVVQADAGKITFIVTEKAWLQSLRDVFQSVKDKLLGAWVVIVRAIRSLTGPDSVPLPQLYAETDNIPWHKCKIGFAYVLKEADA